MLKLKSVNFEQQDFRNHHIELDPSRPEHLIGRGPSCDIVLSSPDVSRIHGKIAYQDGGYHFIDVGSTSGTTIRGQIIDTHVPHALEIGDIIQVGETFLYVEELHCPLPKPTGSIADGATLARLQWQQADLTCFCARIISDTPTVKTFCLVAETPVLFDYQPGQFVNLELQIDGQTVLRPYSISSTPTRPYHLSVTVKRSPTAGPDSGPNSGSVSNWLHDQLQVGDRVRLVGGPMGDFTCVPQSPEDQLPPKILLISAGSGITPMLSMARWVQDTLADCDVVFLHSAKSPEEIICRSELELMSAQMPNFRLVTTITQPLAGQPWSGLTGRISETLLNLVVPDLHARSVFVCGANGFMSGIRDLLAARGFPMENYRSESFGAAPVRPAKTPTDAPPTVIGPIDDSAQNATPSSVNFSQSGQIVPADGSATILELAEQAGVPLRSACRMGACGSCKQSCVGNVRYEQDAKALSAADRAAGYILACVAYPEGAVEVAI
jgi:glycine betaine catabolism B